MCYFTEKLLENLIMTYYVTFTLYREIKYTSEYCIQRNQDLKTIETMTDCIHTI